VQGVSTNFRRIRYVAVLAGAVAAAGCSLLPTQPAPVEVPAPVVVVPEPVAEPVPEPAPSPAPSVARPPALPEIAIVLSSRQPAYEDVARELGKRLENFTLYDLSDRSQPPVIAFRQINDSNTGAVIAIGLRAARSSVAMARSPVIFSQVFNYQDYGLITAKSRGVSALAPLDAHLAAWKKVDPTLASVGMIVGSGHEELVAEAELAAQRHGIELQVQEAGSDQETLYHFKRMIREIDGFWLFPDNRILSPRVLQDMLQQANLRQVPVAVSNEAMLAMGAAISVATVPGDIADTIIDVLRRIEAGRIDDIPPLTGLSEVRVVTNDALLNSQVSADAASPAAGAGTR